MTSVQRATVGVRPSVESSGAGSTAATWLQVAAALAALAVAVIAWDRSVQHGADALLLAIATIPFVVSSVTRRPRPLLPLTGFPVVVFALRDGDVIAAALPAMALLLAVPALPFRVGQLAAAANAAAFVAVAAVQRDVAWAAVAVGMGAAWSAGVSLGALRADVRALRTHATTMTDEAVRAERRRLAREVHDLVAHALTGTMLCLTEIRVLLDDHRVAAATKALDEAERLARSSLADLRTTVRLLSESGDPHLASPIELETDLMHLIEGLERSGVDLKWATTGTPVELSVTSSWAVYRIVQEALTNAVRHAPGCAIRLNLAWGHDGVAISVTNDWGHAGEPVIRLESTGRGVVGMTERAVLLGGRFEAGPTSTGWTVSAWVPVAQRLPPAVASKATREQRAVQEATA